MPTTFMRPCFLLWNCNSLRPWSSLLASAIQPLQPAFIALTETKLGSSSPPALRNYRVYHKPRIDNSLYGGLVMYIHNSCVARRRADLETDSEILFVEMYFPGLFAQDQIPSVLIALVYRQAKKGMVAWNSQLSQLQKIVSSSSSPSSSSSFSVPSHFLIIGDFNDSDASVSSSIASFCSENQFFQIKPASPSRPLSSTSPDFVLSNIPSLVSRIEVASFSVPLLSDHVCLSVPLDSESSVSSDDSYSSYDWAHADWTLFSQTLAQELATASSSSPSSTSFSSLPWLQHLSHLVVRANSSDRPTNEELDFLVHRLETLLHRTASRSLGQILRHPHSLPWGSDSKVMSLYHEAATAARCRLLYPSATTDAWWTSSFKAFSDAVVSFRKLSWKSIVNRVYDSSTRQLQWQLVKPKSEAFNVHEVQSSASSPLLRSTSEVMDALCSHFAKISSPNSSPTFDASFQEKIENDVKQVMSCPLPSSSSIVLTQDDVSIAASRLRLRSAPGPDGVFNRFLKYGGPCLHSALARLFNLLLLCAYVPSSWRIANVMPLYKKKGNRSDFSSYRPISLTSCICKLMERCLYPHLLSIVAPHLHSAQSGFRKGQSTYIRMLDLIDDIQSTLDKHLRLPAIFLDIAKAFDRVWISGLLHKLHSMGVVGLLLQWIASFLSNRFIRVVANGLTSKMLPITAGVPQGSVLSPLLFLVYINDLPSFLPRSVKIGMFADDIVIWKIPQKSKKDVRGDVSNSKILQSALDKVGEWSHKWRVLFGFDKCNVLLFHVAHRKNFPPPFPSLTLCGQSLQFVKEYTYLGLVLNETLNWTNHCEAVTHKLQVASHALCRFTTVDFAPPPPAIRTLILSFLVPIVSYALPFWSPHSLRQKTKINRLMIEPGRRCLGLPRFAPRTAIFASLRLPDFDSLYAICALRFAHRLAASSSSSSLSRKFCNNMEIMRPYRAELRKPISTIVKELAERYHIQLKTTSSSSISSSVLSSFFSSYISKHNAISPFALGDSPRRLPRYLYHDPREVACLRSRLRFVCSHLINDWNVRGLSPKDNKCPHCSVSPDDLHHLLCMCPASLLCRRSYFPTLHHLNKFFPHLSFDDFIIKACLDNLPRCQNTVHDRILSVTGKLLTDLNSIRAL